MLPILPSNEQSPFDSIRRIRPDGSEYWSAREVQPLMGYPRWQDFQRPIERALATARNTGMDTAEHFRGSPENSSARVGRPRKDFELTRGAAYLVAMNGDPNKNEVAAAQLYFAERTRQAELAHSPFMVPSTFAGALELAARQARELESVRAENTDLVATNAKLSPKARVADQYEANPGITPTVFHKAHFPGVGERDFFEHLYRKDYLLDQRNTRWDDRKQEWKDGTEHAHPTAKGKRYFYLAPRLDRNGVRRQQTLVIPGEAELDLVAALERDGLPSRNRPALPGADVVELSQQRRIGGVR
ncbi:DNA replication protein DnaD [Streptomyces sp. B21-083]|uniref:DNA replication protein DnaD n=1 Tax=Streptomyces sp. B21-083 TaxID=3039410 RepID=UPI002FF1CDA6